MSKMYLKRSYLFTTLAMLSVMALNAGCPSGGGGTPPPENQNPTANAGPDQTVDAGDPVTLDGSGSSDPDAGDTLTFAWTPDDDLTGANTDSPTFTAPDVAEGETETLAFELTVSDGNGGTDTETVTVTVNGPEAPPPPVNQPPTADAGPDQSVTGGSTVTLAGSGTDPDGDAVTLEWTPPAGVTLSDPTASNPTFTAPDEDTTLTFTLTASDGNGGTDADDVVVTVTAAPEPRLFIANFNGDNVVHYANPADVNGNIAPNAPGGGNLQGAQTQLDSPADIVVNAAGQLLAANFDGESITTYDNAVEANGNLEPDGNVTGAATTLIDPVSLAVNTAEDLVFVADIFSDDILVFDNTTAATFNGNRAPIRTIASADVNNPFGINFGANDDLYVANNGVDNVVVFANASDANGPVAATRIITSAEFDSLFDVFIDGNDTMFVVDSFDGEIYIFNDAAGLNGPETPDFTLEVNPAVLLTAIAVDSTGTGYIVDFTANAVYSYDDVGTLNGAFNPDRTISGAATQLNGPIRVFLTE